MIFSEVYLVYPRSFGSLDVAPRQAEREVVRYYEDRCPCEKPRGQVQLIRRTLVSFVRGTDGLQLAGWFHQVRCGLPLGDR